MKKSTKISIITISLIIILFFIYKTTYIFKDYKITSQANEPGLKRGEIIFTSNLKKPERLKFICFKDDENYVVAFRLFGLPGDKIQIKNGVAYVNNIAIDQNLSLKHEYFLPSETYNKLINSRILNNNDYYQKYNDSTYTMNITDSIAKRSNISRRKIENSDFRNELINKKWKANFNMDNFGPVVVPQNSYFVLGDNRHASIDSRFIGFINKSKYISTVLNK